VAMMCDLEMPVMSVQNAAGKCSKILNNFIVNQNVNFLQNSGWGYFNTQKKCWNTEILSEAKFPLNFLPNVVMGGDFAGKLTGSAWHLIPLGTPG
jgi:hypothetical protein